MICLICRQAETVAGRTSVLLERGEFRLHIHSVPAYVCPICGESYVDESIAEQLLRIAGQIAEAGIRETQVEYPAL